MRTLLKAKLSSSSAGGHDATQLGRLTAYLKVTPNSPLELQSPPAQLPLRTLLLSSGLVLAVLSRALPLNQGAILISLLQRTELLNRALNTLARITAYYL